MTTGRALSDTAPAASRVQFDLYRRMTPEEKVRCVRDMTIGANSLAMAGLRTRYPGAGERELFLRLAVLRLGVETVDRAYGWRPPDGT